MLSPKNKVEQLEAKSGNILSVFTKTIADLTKVSNEAAKESDNRRIEAAHLVSEADCLDKLVADNRRVVEKIRTILD